MKEMDFFTKHEVSENLQRVRALLLTGILWTREPGVFYNAALIEVLINLKDLLIKAEKTGNRIDFRDDVNPNPNLKIVDITDLISNFRDAACHSDSFRRKVGSTYMSFNRIEGSGSMEAGNIIIENLYDDDIAFNMGADILLLKRHIERAYDELSLLFSHELGIR